MNSTQEKQVIKRAEYFITHYLPYILLLCLFCGIFICLFHYKNKTCIFKKEEDKQDIPLLPTTHNHTNK